MGIHKHKLSNIDRDKRTADCCACGTNVRVYVPKQGSVKCHTARTLARGQRDPQRYRARKYGMSLSDLQELLTKHPACEACGSTNVLCVDHDHITNAVRGVLCRECNVVLGFVQDDANRLEALIQYLKEKR